MGTDAHIFIEIDNGSAEPAFQCRDDIRAFNSGELLIERNYVFFDALANGRSSRIVGYSGRCALFPPRGFPAVASRRVEARYYLRVVRDAAQVKPLGKFQTHGIPGVIEEAYILEHSLPTQTRLVPEWDGIAKREVMQTQTWVADPDWHTASWLFPDQVESALVHFGVTEHALGHCTRAALAVLRLLESALGPRRSRLILWFDN
jgi:hypothetical protein